jgi:hypothetical protein
VAEFVVEEEVLEFDLNAFYKIDEIDGFVTVFVEENVDIEIVFNFVVAVAVAVAGAVAN